MIGFTVRRNGATLWEGPWQYDTGAVLTQLQRGRDVRLLNSRGRDPFGIKITVTPNDSALADAAGVAGRVMSYVFNKHRVELERLMMQEILTKGLTK